jgi:hypothetical protein
MSHVCCLNWSDDVVVEMPSERGKFEVFGDIASRKLASQAALDGVTIGISCLAINLVYFALRDFEIVEHSVRSPSCITLLSKLFE